MDPLTPPDRPMHEKSSDEAAKVIKEMKDHYSLVDKPGKNLNALTLSRVALAFPHLACEYSSIATSRTVPVSSLPPGFPLHMTHSAFANLIPTGNYDIMNDLSNILLYYQIKFSMVVDKKAKKGTNEECREKCLKYIEAGYNSSYVDYVDYVVIKISHFYFYISCLPSLKIG